MYMIFIREQHLTDVANICQPELNQNAKEIPIHALFKVLEMTWTRVRTQLVDRISASSGML